MFMLRKLANPIVGYDSVSAVGGVPKPGGMNVNGGGNVLGSGASIRTVATGQNLPGGII
jgi:hypothetical protein